MTIEAHVISIKRRHFVEERDRHGNVRLYFRMSHGRRVRIREKPGTEEFDRRYHELMRQLSAGELRLEPKGAAKPNTFRWLCQQYMASTEFRALDPRTQRVRRQILDHIFAEPRRDGAAEVFGDCPLSRFTPKAVKILRDRKGDAPESGNARVKHIRSVYAWAIEREIPGVDSNPARDVRFLKPKRVGGFPQWSEADIVQFERRHTPGTKARVAFDLLRYTGVRRSDVILLGR